jgi:hypothetical protein
VVEDQRAAPDRTFRRVESPDACADVTSFECMLVAFSRFRDEACDCSAGDKVCGEAVMADMNRWSQDLAAQLANKNQVPTPEQGREMSDVASEFSRCLMKAITPVNVPPPPPAP